MNIPYINELERLMKTLLCSNCQYLMRVAQLETLMKRKEDIYLKNFKEMNQRAIQAEADVQYYLGEYDKIYAELSTLKKDFEELAKQIEQNKVVIPEGIPAFKSAPKPDWLDDTKPAYPPVVRDNEGSIVQIKPQQIYEPAFELYKVLKDNGVYQMKHDEKLRKIWEIVINRLNYKHDNSDNWKFPIQAWYLREDDCDGGACLFVTLAGLAGIPSDSVFNACGWADRKNKQYYHSYPIAKREDGCWWIYESTIDFLPKEGQKSKESNYSIDSVSNWQWAGQLKSGDQL